MHLRRPGGLGLNDALLYCVRVLSGCPLSEKQEVLGPSLSVCIPLFSQRGVALKPLPSGWLILWGSISAPGIFFDHSPPVSVFATSPNNLEYLLAVSKNLAHPLHPVYDDGKGGGWKWWE